MPLFRTAHLIGIVGTATTPVWNYGICPLTEWEAKTRHETLEPFLVRLSEAILYWDVSPLPLTLMSAVAALLTIVVYVWHPPWRSTKLQSSRSKVGKRLEEDIERR